MDICPSSSINSVHNCLYTLLGEIVVQSGRVGCSLVRRFLWGGGAVGIVYSCFMWFSKPITFSNLVLVIILVHVNRFFKGCRARHFSSIFIAGSKDCSLSSLLLLQLVVESLQERHNLLSHKLTKKRIIFFHISSQYKPTRKVSWPVEREDSSHWNSIPCAKSLLGRIWRSEHLHHFSLGRKGRKWHFCGCHRLTWTLGDQLL